MRKVVLSVVFVAAFLVARYVRINASRSAIKVQPAPTTKSNLNAMLLPPPPPPPPARLDQAQPVDKTWPTYYAIADMSITLRSLDKHGYKVSANYPILAASEPEVRKFNRWIKERVIEDANRFARFADVERPKYTPIARGLWGLHVWCDVYYTNEHFVSLRLTHEEMLPAQTHPIDYSETLNYDLKRGRLLRTTDVFTRGYLRTLSDYSRTYLRERYVVPENWFQKGTKPKVDNFANWNIVPEGVLLSFADYQVGPHSFGQPEIVVPFSALEGAIQPKVLRTLLVSQ